jgi:hypothetical protein
MSADVSRRRGERPLGTRIERDEGVGASLEFEGNTCAPIRMLNKPHLSLGGTGHIMWYSETEGSTSFIPSGAAAGGYRPRLAYRRHSVEFFLESPIAVIPTLLRVNEQLAARPIVSSASRSFQRDHSGQPSGEF